MKHSTSKFSFASLVIFGLLFSGAGSSSGPEKEAPGASPSPAASSAASEDAQTSSHEPASGGESDHDACLVDQTALEDLKKRRSEFEKKSKELAERETELKARERAVEEQIKKMEEIRDQITKGDDLKKKENQEKIAKIVETIESMSPKSAANLIASIDESLAVAAITQVSTPKLAKMMNIMEPARAFRLTELLAGVTRAKRPTSPVAKTDVAVVTKAEKGGEIENANNTESKTNAKSREPASTGGRDKPGK